MHSTRNPSAPLIEFKPMARNDKWVEISKPQIHETTVSENDRFHSTDQSDYSEKWTRTKAPIDPRQWFGEAPSSSRALDEVLIRLKENITFEQEAMDDLLTRLRKRAG